APVVINGRRVPLAGRVSMDFAAVDLGPDAPDAIGDRVVLWGDELPVEEVAEHAGTVPYTLMCGVRAPRLVVPSLRKNPILTPASCTRSLSLSLRACAPMGWPLTSG